MFDINQNIPLLLSLAFVVGGLVALAWSADRFVDAAASLARRFGVSPLIVGMVIIGFGTSAPELAVSTLSGLSGHSNLSMGNAYGSCIFNLCAILGATALIKPIRVKPSAFIGAPLLAVLAGISLWLVCDGAFSRGDGLLLLGLFAVLFPAYGLVDRTFNPPGAGSEEESTPAEGNVVKDAFWLVFGLALLMGSSHILVWGCVDFARDVLHVSDLMIGLTVVAAGTSLPELASAIASARRGENELVVGNIIGSNLFNTLAVVGIAGSICPFSEFSKYVLSRDLPLMIVASLVVLWLGVNQGRDAAHKRGDVVRWEGALLLAVYFIYLGVMIYQEAF